jgi:elongator complex protein 3
LNYQDALREIIETLKDTSSPSHDSIDHIKRQIAGKYQLEKMPSNSELIAVLADEEEEARLLPILRRKATRTISGVTVIAVMTKPHLCPQVEPCAYCPGGPTIGVPQSYTGFEPAAMRGLQNQFDPQLQVRSRIKQLQAIGHEVDKIELIIMGGTFPATPQEYQENFIKGCLDTITDENSANLEAAKKNAETSNIRNVGITVETRPDWAKQPQIDHLLSMGVTRVELGVQHQNNDIYNLVGRMHTVHDVIEATQIMKDAGLKIVYHLMPGLPGSNPEKDLEAFKQVFTDPDFKPDMIKIYPCLVLKDTKAYKWHCKGKYQPYTSDTAADLIVEIKKIIPQWIRIMRVQRDIPAQLIVAGVTKSNLRQLVKQKLRRQGIRCKCIRCREVGHRIFKDKAKPTLEKMKTLNTKYQASQGTEIFISTEDQENDILIGYLRLRIPSQKAHRPEVKTKKCSIVRELHVYGPLVPVGKHLPGAWQHKGFGNLLLHEAERISKEDYDLRKVLIMSGLGTKQYYMQFGYQYDGAYMSKKLEN